MTLLELTVVILVLLSLVTILMIGGQAWKPGADRSACIMNIRNAQLGVRSFQNMNGLQQGTTLDVATQVMGVGGFFPDAICPAGGSYDFVAHIPAFGELAMTCSYAGTRRHQPENYGGW